MAQIDNLDQTVGTAQLLRWSVARSAGVVTVTLEGELDLANHAPFGELLAKITSTKPVSVVVDLSQLTFLDSSGIRCLIAAARDASADDIRLVVRRPRPAVRRVIEVCGLDELLLGASSSDAPPNR